MSHAQTIGRGPSAPMTARGTRTPVAAPARVPTLLLTIFMLSLLPPVYFYIGTVLFTPERVLLMILFIPFLVKLLSKAAGPIQKMDIFMLLWGFWIVVTLVVHHGLPRLPYGLITMVELVGGYLAGRILVRNAASYRTFIKLLLWTLILLLPPALVELLTNRNLLQEIFGAIAGTYNKGGSSYGRMGMERVMGGFAHPILFGLYCSMGLASAYLLYDNFMKRVLVLAFTMAMTFMSLSSGPLLAANIQAGLLIWGWVTRGRWWLLAGITTFCYVTIDLLSNRTPITILINYVTFNPATAWTRVNIYHFGIKEVWASPVFGIGLNDWARPYWLTGSVDNFWLLIAMRHGIPGFLLIFLGMLLHCRAIWKSPIASAKIRSYRTGYLITVISLFLTLSTVHIWGAVSVFVMFFLGAGAWFVDVAPEKQEVSAPEEPERPSRTGSTAAIRPSVPWARPARAHFRHGAEQRTRRRVPRGGS